MKKYIIHIKFLGLIILVIFLYGFASHRSIAKKITNIDVVFSNNENLFISYETVNKLLIQSLRIAENESKENINLNNVEKIIQANQMIENVEVFQTLNGEIGALITQRTPVLRVLSNSESCYYDDKGLKMPLSYNFSARVPITTSEIKKENCEDIVYLANKIRKDDFLRKQIIGINQIEGKDSKQFELSTREGEQIIIFGDLKRMESKIKNLKVFYKKVISEGSLNNYKTINLKFNNQVVCTKK